MKFIWMVTFGFACGLFADIPREKLVMEPINEPILHCEGFDIKPLKAVDVSFNRRGNFYTVTETMNSGRVKNSEVAKKDWDRETITLPTISKLYDEDIFITHEKRFYYLIRIQEDRSETLSAIDCETQRKF